MPSLRELYDSMTDSERLRYMQDTFLPQNNKQEEIWSQDSDNPLYKLQENREQINADNTKRALAGMEGMQAGWDLLGNMGGGGLVRGPGYVGKTLHEFNRGGYKALTPEAYGEKPQPMTARMKRTADIGGWDTTKRYYHGTRAPDNTELEANYKEFGLHVAPPEKQIQANDRLIGRDFTDMPLEKVRALHPETLDSELSGGEGANIRPFYLPKYGKKEVATWHDLGHWNADRVLNAIEKYHDIPTETLQELRDYKAKHGNWETLEYYKQFLLDMGIKAIRYENTAEGVRPNAEGHNYSYALLQPEKDMLHDLGWSKADEQKLYNPQTTPEEVVSNKGDPWYRGSDLTLDARGRQMSLPAWFDSKEQVEAFGELWRDNPEMLQRAEREYARRSSGPYANDPEMMTQNRMLQDAIQYTKSLTEPYKPKPYDSKAYEPGSEMLKNPFFEDENLSSYKYSDKTVSHPTQGQVKLYGESKLVPNHYIGKSMKHGGPVLIPNNEVERMMETQRKNNLDSKINSIMGGTDVHFDYDFNKTPEIDPDIKLPYTNGTWKGNNVKVLGTKMTSTAPQGFWVVIQKDNGEKSYVTKKSFEKENNIE